MKRKALFVLAVCLILVGIFIIIKIAANALSPIGAGALQVTTNIKAQVYLDGKKIGEAPLCKCSQNDTIREGEHEVIIDPNDKKFNPFTTKVKITGGVLTAVERTFLLGAFSSSYVLSLEKTGQNDPQLFVASIPDGALINLDGNPIGVTPLSQKISASEHELEVQKQGFNKKTLRIRAAPSYKLIVNVMLGTQSTGEDETTTVPTPTPTPTVAQKNSITILQTPTGFLNVRQDPNAQAKKIAEVKPNEIYEYTKDEGGWFYIKLTDGTLGWINGTYAKIVSPTPQSR